MVTIFLNFFLPLVHYLHVLQENGFMELENGEKMKEERLMGRRVDLELHDYEGPGANKEHDPKSPGGNGWCENI